MIQDTDNICSFFIILFLISVPIYFLNNFHGSQNQFNIVPKTFPALGGHLVGIKVFNFCTGLCEDLEL